MSAPHIRPVTRHPLVEAAILEYGHVCCIPVRPDTKHPYIEQWQKRGPAAYTDVLDWIDKWPDMMLGVVTGKVTGVWMLDVDNRDDKRGEQTLVELEQRYGPLPRSCAFKTPSGFRLCFKWAPEIYVRTVAGVLGPGLDVRGHRPDGSGTGQSIIPPSTRADGVPYFWGRGPDGKGHHFSTAEDAPPAWLFLVGFSRKERDTLAALGITGPDGFSGKPPAEWRAIFLEKVKATRGSLLPRGSSSCAKPILEMPDKPLSDSEKARVLAYLGKAFEGCCADIRAARSESQDQTLNNQGLRINSLLKGAAFLGVDVAQLEAEAFQKYTDACVAMECSRETEPWTDSHALAKWEHTSEDADAAELLSKIRHDTNDVFGTIEPDFSILKIERAPAPPLPLTSFGPLADWLVEGARATSCAPDYLAAGLLAASAAQIGTTRSALAFGDWRQPSILWTIALGFPSSRKSPGLEMALKPLEGIEKEMWADNNAERSKHEMALALAQQRRTSRAAATKEAQRTKGQLPEMPPEALLPPEPSYNRAIIKDATPEAVAERLAENPRGLLLARDELRGLLDFDRYGGGDANRAFYTEAYGGGAYTIDRKGKSPLNVPSLTLPITGTTQPDTLNEMLLQGTNDGLAARFLMFWPEPVHFKRDDRPLDLRRVERVYRRLRSLTGERVVVRTTAEASDALEHWYTEHDRATLNLPGMYGAAMGKMPGVALRLALVLEHMLWADSDAAEPPQNISVASVRSAIDLVENYFKGMLARVYGVDGAATEAERTARMLARGIIKRRALTFDIRDVQREWGFKGFSRNDKGAAEKLEAAADRLVAARIVSRQGQRGAYTVTPSLLDQEVD